MRASTGDVARSIVSDRAATRPGFFAGTEGRGISRWWVTVFERELRNRSSLGCPAGETSEEDRDAFALTDQIESHGKENDRDGRGDGRKN